MAKMPNFQEHKSLDNQQNSALPEFRQGSL